MSAFPDAAARDEARFDLDANLAVEAGAGTGKTTLLIDRITFWLLGRPKTDREAGLQHLVALTFTEKAAGEIKLRLQERLLALVEVLRERRVPGKDYRHIETVLAEVEARFGMRRPDLERVLGDALAQLDRAQIGTIHSFAAHLLRLYPLEAGVAPDFEVDQGDRFEEMFDEEWARWLDVELGEAAPRPREWIEVLGEVELDDLRALAMRLCEAKVDPGGLALSEDRAADLAEMFRTAAGEAEDLSKLNRGAKPLKMHLELETCAAVFRELADVLEGKDGKAEPPRFQGAASTSKKFDDEQNRRYKSMREMARTANAYNHLMMRRCLELLMPFARAFRAAYARRGWVSFDDLLLKARDLVRGKLHVRAELRAQYKTILIDEFQDTDPLQGELLMLLGEGEGYQAGAWDQVKLGPGRLFIVGDPKQSIYHFRGADMRAYQDFIAHMTGQNARRVQLRTNFRSRAGILERVNEAFRTLMVEEEGVQAGYVDLAPRPGAAGGKLEAAVMTAPDGKLSTEQGREAEGEWIARWIARRCGADGEHAFGDVAILMRATSSLPFYIEALRRHGVPYVVEGEKYFYGTPEVSDFLNLLRCLDDPDDALALTGLLRSPFVGLTDREIADLGRSRAGLDYRKDPPPGLDCAERVKRVYADLRRWRGWVGRRPLADIVHGLVTEGFFLELASLAYHREQTASNLFKFVRLAAQASHDRGLTLKEFTDQVARSVRGAQEEGESPLADERVDAVRILTMHKAKGLEFPVVFLPDVTRRANRASRSTVIRDWGGRRVGLRLERHSAANIEMAFLEARERARRDAEEVRVLYVAMTRAKEKLILSGNDSQTANGVFSKLLAGVGLWPAKGERPETVGGGAVEVTYVPYAAPEPSVPAEAAAAPGAFDARAAAAKWRARVERGEAAGAKDAFVSPSAEHGEAEKWAFAADEDASEVRADVLGSVCHAVLERWDFASPRFPAAALAAAAAEHGEGLSPAERAALSEQAEAMLRAFAKSERFAALRKAEILGRELPFIAPESPAPQPGAPGPSVVRGVIDLLVREGQAVSVVDYKTDNVKPGRAAAQAAAKRYAGQGRLYVRAVRELLGVPARFEVVFLRTGEAVRVDTVKRRA